MSYFQLYIKTECPFCKKALDILDEHDKMMVVTVLDRAPAEVVQTIKTGFNHKTVPIVLEATPEGLRKIGGFTELEKYLNTQDAEIVSISELSDEEQEKERAAIAVLGTD